MPRGLLNSPLPVPLLPSPPFRPHRARKRPGRGQLLNAVVARVGDVDVAEPVDGDPVRRVELAVADARRVRRARRGGGHATRTSGCGGSTRRRRRAWPMSSTAMPFGVLNWPGGGAGPAPDAERAERRAGVRGPDERRATVAHTMASTRLMARTLRPPPRRRQRSLRTVPDRSVVGVHEPPHGPRACRPRSPAPARCPRAGRRAAPRGRASARPGGRGPGARRSLTRLGDERLQRARAAVADLVRDRLRRLPAAQRGEQHEVGRPPAGARARR